MVTDHPRFIVGQLGARMHYAVPRILEQAGWLLRLHTDFLAPPADSASATALRMLGRHFGLAKRILSRSPAAVPSSKISSHRWFGVEYATRLYFASRRRQARAPFLWAGRQFARRIAEAGLDDANAVYLFNSAALEALEAAREKGCFCVLEQTIAPMSIESRLLDAERSKWEDWEPKEKSEELISLLADREQREWQVAHLVLCGSDFVADGIRISGGPHDRCSVVPYGFTASLANMQPKMLSPNRTLNVLFLGAVGLRKGIQYLYQAALKLPPDRVTIRAAGPITLSPAARRKLQGRILVSGPVPRTEVQRLYQWADVFVLPSICEGSATVCYEALAAGLPVITTPNAGSVVRDGVEGFIVRAGDAEAIANRLEFLLRQPSRLTEMSQHALLRSADFTEEHYARRLIATIERAWMDQAASPSSSQPQQEPPWRSRRNQPM